MLWFGRVSRIHPGSESAEECIHFYISILKHEERRTGACVFARSGAVGDDPLIFVEGNVVVFKIFQRN
jgi:hypothetical protein